MKKRNERLISLLLALLMLLSLLPTAAFAAVGEGEDLDDDAVAVTAVTEDDAPNREEEDVPAEVEEDIPVLLEEDDAPADEEENIPVVLAADDTAAAATTYDYTGAVTASAPSYQGVHPANLALDNNTGTWWHTAWNSDNGGTGSLTDLSNDPGNRYIQLDLTETIQLDGLRYLSRSAETNPVDFGNGVVTQYRIEVSTDGTNFTPVSAGSWEPGGSAWRIAVFPEAVAARYVRLYGVRTYGNGEGYNTPVTRDINKYMSAAEIRLLTNVPDDYRPTNLARLEGVTVDDNDINETNNQGDGKKLDGAAAIDGIKTNVNNAAKPSGHWSTPQNPTKPVTLTVDLHRMCSVDMVKLFWKHDAVTAYTVQGSADGTTWTDIGSKSSRVSAAEGGELVAPASSLENIRYVRLSVTNYDNQGTAGWANVNLWEIEIYGTAGNLITEATNLARLDGVTARASGNETSTFPPEKVFDGNTSTNNSRWSSANDTAPAWIIVDLHRMSTVTGIDLYWQRDNVVSYKLEVSSNKKDWTLVHSTDTRITQLHETFHENTYENVRYVRVYCDNHDDKGASTYNNISLWEIEVYGIATGELIPSVSSVLDSLLAVDSRHPLEVNDDQTKVVLKDAAAALVPDGFSVKIGANLEQVVDVDGTIYTPVADRKVAIDLSVVDDSDPDEVAITPADNPIYITILRKENEKATDEVKEKNLLEGNAKPAVIPEIMEWFSHGQNAGYYRESYTLGDSVRILYRYAFAGVAKELQADLKDLYGIDAELKRLDDTTYSTLQTPGILMDGDIVLFDVNPNSTSEDTRNRVQGYDDETYGMEIYGGKVYIYATHPTGAYWATRTLLQGMKLSEDGKSFPNGTLRDYPEFKIRGFMLDVGRKPLSMDMLKTIAKNMAWYKLNDLHIHLNDNLIFMEDYCDGKTDHKQCASSAHMNYQSAYEAYSAFRMESHVQEEPGAKPLTAQDYAYTKPEFKQFIKDASALGINIIPEFDVPAHAKAITDAFPSLRLNKSGTFMGTTRPWIDHLDLTNKMDESLAKVQEIFDEYLTGSDPVFSGDIVDFGADEYYDDYSKYAPFAKGMVDYIQSKGKTVRMWGSFSLMGDNNNLFTKEVAKNIQMNIWSTMWADPQAMYDKGFQLININCYPGYIVPSGTGTRGNYGDRLNMTQVDELYPNKIQDTWIHASSDQMLGAAYAIWQDNIDTRACGLDEVDTFDRFYEGLALYSERLWGARREKDAIETLSETIGTAPGTNPYYKAGETDSFTYDFTDNTDKSGNSHTLTLTGAELNTARSLLVLKGGVSYAETGLDRLGWGNQLSFRAFKLTGGGEEQIIFEADHAYGDYAIKALPVEGDATKWKLGFSRELYDYEFDVELPVGEWVSLTLTVEQQSTKLTYDGTEYPAVGKFVSNPDSNTQFRGKTGITYSSFELPVARIGSKENAFNGYLAAVTTGEAIELPPSPLTETKYDIPTAKYTVTAGSEEATAHNNNTEGPLSYATDNNVNTYWHSKYTDDLRTTPDKRWIQIELDAATQVSLLRYQPRPTVANGIVTQYRVEVSTDGTNFTPVSEGDWAHDTTAKLAVFDSAVTAKYIRLYGVETQGGTDDAPNQFMSCAEIRVCRPIDLDTDVHATAAAGEVTWGETEATAEITVTLDSGYVLTEGTDYEVTYSNNTTVGDTATATVTGKGGYVGTLTATFTVPAKPVIVSLSDAAVTFAQTSYPLENGKAEPDPIVKVGDTTLLRGLDYTVTYADNTAVGTATVTVTGIGDYTGEKTATFTVVPAIVKKNLSDATKTKVTLHQTSFPYEGEAIRPEVVVTYNGETLTQGRDYTVSYARNNAVGTGTVTVTGVAPYCEGRATANFTIIDPAAAKNLSDRTKTTVTFAQQSYDLVNGKAEPEPTVRYEGKRLTKGTDYTVSYLNNKSGGTGVVVLQGAGEYIGSFTATFTINGGGTSSGDTPGTSSGGSGGGGSGSSSTKTETEAKPDGVTVTTTTDKRSGEVSVTAKYPDGATVKSQIPVKGAVTATVTLPADVEKATVVVPTLTEATAGQVAILVHPDGTEEILKDSLPAENGVEVTLTGSATLKIVDNTKQFIDVPEDGWAKESITFVTSREIFNGTGNGTFTPDSPMSRAMVCTVLANLENVDVKSDSVVWYEKAVDWAKNAGVSDGTNPEAIVTREQLAVMLYRYMGSPAVEPDMDGEFADVEQVSDWAKTAMTWAVQNSIIRGRDGSKLAPQDTATRAEVAVMFQRYIACRK